MAAQLGPLHQSLVAKRKLQLEGRVVLAPTHREENSVEESPKRAPEVPQRPRPCPGHQQQKRKSNGDADAVVPVTKIRRKKRKVAPRRSSAVEEQGHGAAVPAAETKSSFRRETPDGEAKTVEKNGVAVTVKAAKTQPCPIASGFQPPTFSVSEQRLAAIHQGMTQNFWWQQNPRLIPIGNDDTPTSVKTPPSSPLLCETIVSDWPIRHTIVKFPSGSPGFRETSWRSQGNETDNKPGYMLQLKQHQLKQAELVRSEEGLRQRLLENYEARLREHKLEQLKQQRRDLKERQREHWRKKRAEIVRRLSIPISPEDLQQRQQEADSWRKSTDRDRDCLNRVPEMVLEPDETDIETARLLYEMKRSKCAPGRHLTRASSPIACCS